jgi:hypothetical protein
LKNTTARTQRNFVVEYKSARRRSKIGVKSIWGDTDLKALVRAVADDMPRSEMTSNDKDDIEPEAARGGTTQNSEQYIDASIATDENISTDAILEGHLQPAAPIGKPGVADQPYKPKRRIKSRVKTEPRRPKETIQARPTGSIATLSTEDILSILEMENRRLKELLAEKLRRENMKMKEMLQRFGA